MHRSSESIAALAAALAKAQMALTNPEKSLTGTVPAGRTDEPPRTFRYAPLSSGLDIVRKTLGEHGIATMQTTTIDQDIQTVSLTTVLAHASGEWIASDWPVCVLSDMAAPRRMGAALTYARRYALFTLVGIAGEDDLDAPDLCGQPVEGTGKAGNRLDPKRQSGYGSDRPLGAFAMSRKSWSPPKQTLEPDKSAALRDWLLGELAAVTEQDQLTAWACKAMGAKNTLLVSDTAHVEAQFASRMSEIEGSGEGPPWPGKQPQRPLETHAAAPAPADRAPLMAALRASVALAGAQGPKAAEVTTDEGQPDQIKVNNAVAWHVDKSALILSEPRRYRDRAHLRFVSAQPCLICGRRPSDAHHIRFAQPRALGRRVSDEFTVPLCRSDHRALHRYGNEAMWWDEYKLDPIVAAQRFWQKSRLDGGRVEALLSVGVIEELKGSGGAEPT